ADTTWQGCCGHTGHTRPGGIGHMGVVEGLKLRGHTYWSDFYWGGQRIRKTLHTRDLATALERLRYLRAGLAGADVVIADDVSATAAQRTAGEQLAPEPSEAPGDGQEDASGFLELANAYLADLRLRTDKRNSIRCAEYQVGQLVRVVPALR